MANNFYKFKKGIQLDPQTGSTVTTEGDIAYNNTSNQLEIKGDSVVESITTDSNTQTLANKTLDNSSVITVKDSNLTIQDNSDVTKQAKFELSGITSGQTRTITLPDTDVTLSGSSNTETLSNKTLDNSNTVTLKDTLFTLQDDGDTSKQAKFQLSGITTATTRTLTVPDANTTIVGTDATQTLTNKTLSGNTATNLVSGSGTFTFNTTGTITAPNATDTLVGKATTDTLTNKSISRATNTINGFTNSAVLIADGSGNATSEATLATSRGGTNISSYTTGDILYASSSSVLSKLAVGSANQVIKSVGGIPSWATAPTSGINYISGNPDAEADTSGWSTYADTAKNIPDDGTGGSPNSTWTRTTSTPLRGTGSFLWTKSGSANRQGEGVSYDFTLDVADKAKVLSVSFDYIVASGTFTASDGITAPLNDNTTSTNAGNSDLEVFIYDITNAVLIPVSPQVLTSNSSTTAFSFKGTFQTASNSTSYRLIIHTATTTTNNFTVQFDNFAVGPQSFAQGSPISDWIAYTPTIVGMGTVTNNLFEYRRVGDSLEIRGSFTTGTTTGSTVTVTYPTGFTSASSTRIPATSISGVWSRGNTGETQTFYNLVTANSTTFGVSKQSGGSTTALTGASFGSTEFQLVSNLIVPIAGLSSSVQMSNETDTRAVVALVTGDPASATSGNPIIVPTVSFDSHGAYNASTGRYTVPVSGVYKLYGALQSASSATTLTIYKNAVSTSLAGNLDSNGEATYCSAVNCVAGDVIDIRPGGTVDATSMTLNIERLSGPATIATTESINARYFASATSISGSLATVSWTTKDFDTHSGMSSGTYTVPASGKYQVNTALALSGTFALNTQSNIVIQKNGSTVSEELDYAGGAETNVHLNLSDIISCVAGDTLRVQVSSGATGPAIVSSNSKNYISISRVGN